MYHSWAAPLNKVAVNATSWRALPFIKTKCCFINDVQRWASSWEAPENEGGSFGRHWAVANTGCPMGLSAAVLPPRIGKVNCAISGPGFGAFSVVLSNTVSCHSIGFSLTPKWSKCACTIFSIARCVPLGNRGVRPTITRDSPDSCDIG